MVKAYQRYVPAGAWGVVASACSIAFDASGKLLWTGCLEDVVLWNVKQGAQVQRLSAPLPPAGVAPEATVLVLAASGKQLAVGYADGTVRSRRRRLRRRTRRRGTQRAPSAVC